MKVIGITGSPRRGGNTEILLDNALEGAISCGAETEKIILNDLNISPCREEEYENTDENGFSVIKDDIHQIFQKIEKCNVLIVASPIFFGSISGQTKIMIDRFQCVWLSKKNIFTNEKKGGFISVAADTRKEFFDNARSIIKHFFAVINVEYREELFCPGVEKKGKVLEHAEFLDQAYQIGVRLSYNHTF